MKNGILAFLLLLVGVISCQSNTKNGTQPENKAAPTALHAKPAPAPVENMRVSTDTIVNNAFVARVLDNDISLSKISAAYHSIRQALTIAVNKYDSHLTDTLKTLTSGTDTFAFLIATEKETQVSYNIQTSTIRLDTTLVIGAPKSAFTAKFGIKNVPDLLIVRDLEGGSEFKFLFNPVGKLVKMNYQIQYLE